MNRTLKEATVERYYYDTHTQSKQHLCDFVDAYNFAKRLKTLKGITPYEFIIKCWQNHSQGFKFNPIHHTGGLYKIVMITMRNPMSFKLYFTTVSIVIFTFWQSLLPLLSHLTVLL